jgi:hypothetical protein
MASLAEVRKLYARAEEMASRKSAVDIEIDWDTYSFKLNGSKKLVYTPSKTGLAFHQSNAFVRVIMGPVGSGKSTINCADIIFQSARMPAWNKGVRSSKFLIIRNTYAELKTTTLPEWLHWFSDLGDANPPAMNSPIQYRANFNDGHGPISIHVIFIALDRPKDVKKLDSLNCTSAYINELRYIEEDVLGKTQQRVNRYPTEDIQFKYGAKSLIGKVNADTNPPKVKSWLFNIFEIERPEKFELFRQPSGLIETKEGEYSANPHAENLERLGLSYYVNAIPGKRDREKIKVDLMGEYGISSAGKRIYHEYSDDMHCVDRIDYIPQRPVYLGVDYETCPSVVFAQVSPNGRVHLIKELCAAQAGFRSFIENIFLPYVSQNLRDYELIITDDPSGNSKQPTDEKSCRMLLAEYGFRASPAYSNYQAPRLEAVRTRLNRNIDGKSAFVLSKQGCELIREGFLGEYHYKQIGTSGGKEDTDKPEKNRHADIHDAVQYCIMGIDGHIKKQTRMKPIIKPKGGKWI